MFGKRENTNEGVVNHLGEKNRMSEGSFMKLGGLV